MITKNQEYLKDYNKLNEKAIQMGIKTNQLVKVYWKECEFWKKQYKDYFGIDAVNDTRIGSFNQADDPIGYHIGVSLEQALIRTNRYFEQLNPQVLEEETA